MAALLSFWSSPSEGTFLPFWFVLGFLLAVSVASLRTRFFPDRVCAGAALLTLLGLIGSPSRATCGGELLFEGWLLCASVAVAWGFRRANFP